MNKNQLLEITDCSNFCKIKENELKNHPCSKIVDFQKLFSRVYMPEPWSGDILNAPILFLSSNPSISSEEFYPDINWPEEMIADFFINRFKDRGEKYSWVYENKVLNKDNERGKSVRYWSSINNRANELFDNKNAVQGIDYCITEIVHCKSTKEKGVNNARTQCSEKHLESLINYCGANVIIGIGSVVKKHLNEKIELFGKPIFYLPHPNAFEAKKFENKFTKDEINDIRRLVKINNNLKEYDFKLPSDEEVISFIKMNIS